MVNNKRRAYLANTHTHTHLSTGSHFSIKCEEGGGPFLGHPGPCLSVCLSQELKKKKKGGFEVFEVQMPL